MPINLTPIINTLKSVFNFFRKIGIHTFYYLRKICVCVKKQPSLDMNQLKVDLDMKTLEEAKEHIVFRLNYLDTMKFVSKNQIKSIIFTKKTKWNCKIILKYDIDVKTQTILQLVLGSDYRKEVNTLVNYYKLGMIYHNRLFDIKIYDREGKDIKGVTERFELKEW